VNTEEFISSGVLESYVLGTASAEEIKKIWELQKTHPEIIVEIEAIEASLLSYAESGSSKLSPGLKNKIEKQLFLTSSNVLQMPADREKAIRVLRFSAAAAVALLLCSSIFNLTLYKKLDTAKRELAGLYSEKSTLAGLLNVQQTLLETKNNEVAMMMKPGNKMIALKGMDLSPASSATIIWNTNDKSVYINGASLPMPSGGKQYQLWALVDGKPVDAGIFTMTGGTFLLQKMKDMPDAQAFAVTLEKAGGSVFPTMEAMFLMGNV
jgi:anti-sigma-K factor RskA